MNNTETTIFVVSHKPYNKIKDKLYKTIQVGKNGSNSQFGDVTDNTGINIADKNPNFCELTAFYWIWKNYEKQKYIGICHYRRYFTNFNLFKSSHFFITNKQIDSLLMSHDIILPKQNQLHCSVKEYYIKCDGIEKDLSNTRKVISEIYPSYLSSFDDICNGNKASYCNMLITSRDVFDEYCEWLFGILFKVEEITDLTGYTKAQKRVFGYISEILLNVWVLHNDLDVFFMGVVNTESSIKYRIEHKNRQ